MESLSRRSNSTPREGVLEVNEQTYSDIKEHFMARFTQIDQTLILINRKPDDQAKQEIAFTIREFVQEGVGALLAYLPHDAAVATIKDYLDILEPGGVQAMASTNSISKPSKPIPVVQNVADDDALDERLLLENEPALISSTQQMFLTDLSGQIDYMSPISNDAFIVGSTVGQVAIYNSHNLSLIRVLIEEGLSVYEQVISVKAKRMAIACDGGMALIFDTETYDKVGQVTAQKPDITSLIYVSDNVLLVGQVAGYLDVITFSDEKATVTHSLRIGEAGDINAMCQGPGKGEVMLCSQKGLILTRVTKKNTLEIISAVEDYVGLYGVNISWAGDMRYVVITSRPRFSNKREVPPGEENYAVISYSLYDGHETDPNKRQVILGQYKTSFIQATFSLSKVQVIVPRPNAIDQFPDESPFRGRFFLTVIDKHLKLIDTKTYRLFDLLSENNFDQEAVNAMGLTRSLKDRTSTLLLLCHKDSRSYIQRIDFNPVLPFSLFGRAIRQIDQSKLQKNQLGPTEL